MGSKVTLESDEAREFAGGKRVRGACGHKITIYDSVSAEHLRRHGCTACQKLALQKTRAHALRDRRPFRDT